MRWDLLTNVAALSILVAAAVTLIMLLMRKWQDAVISFLATVICCFATLGFGDADARSKGFESGGHMLAAQKQGYTNPEAWRNHLARLIRWAKARAVASVAQRVEVA